MHEFNIAQVLLWICNYHSRKFDESGLNANLAHLGKSPSLSKVAVIFAEGVELFGTMDKSAVQEALSKADRAASICERAYDELLQNLLNGKLAIRGRPVPEEAFVIPLIASFGHRPGCEPVKPFEVIPANEFAALKFIDGEGIEAVPMDQTRKFPRWRDPSVAADKVRRLWSAESHRSGAESKTEADTRQPDKKTGRPNGTGYAALDAPLVAEINKLVDDGKAKSHSEAALRVIGMDGSRATGIGSVEAKISRLVKQAKDGRQQRKTERK